MGLTLGFIIDRSDSTPLDPSTVDAAARRVVNRWEMLAGRIEWNKAAGVWSIITPGSSPLPASYSTHQFTTSASSETIEIPALESNSAILLPPPSSALFRHPSTPVSNADYAKTKSPILSVHITTLTGQEDVLLLGISAPHGVFDATGLGMIVAALDAELSGRQWTPPPSPSSAEGTNVLQRLLKESNSSSEGSTELGEEMIRDFVPSTWTTWLWTVGSFAKEYFWNRVELKGLYLGEEVVRKIVEPIKEAAKEEGGWVSTGDALVEWLLKSIYSGTTSPNSLAVSSIFTVRPIFPSLGPYPHNAVGSFSIPLIPISTLSKSPPAQIAKAHRSALTTSRTPSGLRSVADVVGTFKDRVPRRGVGEDSYIFTNHHRGSSLLPPYYRAAVEMPKWRFSGHPAPKAEDDDDSLQVLGAVPDDIPKPAGIENRISAPFGHLVKVFEVFETSTRATTKKPNFKQDLLKAFFTVRDYTLAMVQFRGKREDAGGRKDES
ncbi:hypothetical protein P7C70_g7901, partial [Phenoliferia sp. Uapishka_3]